MPKPEWYEQRKKCIGGSDAAAVLGVSPWAQPIDVFCDKTGVSQPLVENEAMRWGKLLEPVVMAEFTMRTGMETLPRRYFTHPKYPFLGGNTDAAIKGRVNGRKAGLEVKTARSGEGWGQEGTDEIPIYYLTQNHHYLLVTGWDVWYTTVLIGGSTHKTYVIERDEEAIELMLEGELEFWNEYVVPNIPPPVTEFNKNYAMYLLGKTRKNAVDAEGDAALTTVMDEIFNASLLKKRAEVNFNQAKLAVMEQMAQVGADKLYNESGYVNWGRRRGRATTDWRAVCREAGIDYEVVAKHTKKGEPGEFFKVTSRLIESEEQMKG